MKGQRFQTKKYGNLVDLRPKDIGRDPLYVGVGSKV